MRRIAVIAIVVLAVGVSIFEARDAIAVVSKRFREMVVFHGQVVLGDEADDKITANGYLTQARVGTGSTPDQTFAADDLFVEGEAEIDGALWIDGNATVQAGNTLNAADDGAVRVNTLKVPVVLGAGTAAQAQTSGTANPDADGGFVQVAFATQFSAAPRCFCENPGTPEPQCTPFDGGSSLHVTGAAGVGGDGVYYFCIGNK